MKSAPLAFEAWSQQGLAPLPDLSSVSKGGGPTVPRAITGRQPHDAGAPHHSERLRRIFVGGKQWVPSRRRRLIATVVDGPGRVWDLWPWLGLYAAVVALSLLHVGGRELPASYAGLWAGTCTRFHCLVHAALGRPQAGEEEEEAVPQFERAAGDSGMVSDSHRRW